MRLKCGFIIRTLLLTTLLYLIYLISKDDASSQTLKDSILHQLPNNHYHNRRSQWLQHREAEIEKVKNNLSDDENRFIDPENIQSNSENFNADFDSNFNDADSNDSSSQSKTRSSQNRFGKVPIQVKKFEGVEVNFNSIENDASKFNHKQTGKIPDFEDEVTDNSLKIQAEIVPKRQFHRTYDPDEIEQPMRIPENYNPKLDTLRGTVGSLIYFNSTVKEPYYTPKFLGNYEEVTNPCEHVDSHESYAKNDGECGRAIKLNAEEEKQVPDIIKKFGFNLIASDKVPMTRNPKDLRHKECKHWNYPAKVDLPKVIVILVFYNEGWGPLMRTVHTVINQTPPELLAHIVMVDDCSPRSHLHERLDNYIEDNWGKNGLVRLYRNQKREGLIRARINGAKHSLKLEGDVLVYLDAHCEPGYNWLPPLIAPIARDKRITTVPLIDSINGNDYTFSPQGGGDSNGHARGAWDWSMLWKRMPLNEEERKKHKYVTEPYGSPAMAGGLFAIDKHYFKDIGFYDPGLEIWGGENFEISYKVWMCHGQVLFVPCSRVGHIYRLEGWNGNPPPEYVPSSPSLRNYKRVVEVWWDEYKEYFYTTRPETVHLKYGDISPQKLWREQNQCHSFQWFLDNVTPDLLTNFPLPPLNIRWGELRLKDSRTCLDGMGMKNGNGRIATYSCHGQGGNQLFRLTEGKQLAQYDSCVTMKDKNLKDTEKPKAGAELSVYQCNMNEYNNWEWDQETYQIYFITDKQKVEKFCIEKSMTTVDVTLELCSESNPNQKWDFKQIEIPDEL